MGVLKQLKKDDIIINCLTLESGTKIFVRDLTLSYFMQRFRVTDAGGKSLCCSTVSLSPSSFSNDFFSLVSSQYTPKKNKENLDYER